MNYTFRKSERINSKLIIDKLFAGGNSSNAVFPLRIVYMAIPKEEAPQSMDDVPASILISVPKKRFRNAVDRNRLKRLIREAYRTNKGVLWQVLEEKDYRVAIAFISITDKMPTFYQVNKAVARALVIISEKIQG